MKPLLHRRITGVLCSQKFNRSWAQRAKDAGEDAGLDIVVEYVDRPEDVSAGLTRLVAKVDAIWITADPVVLSEVEPTREFFAQARTAGKPVFTYSGAYAAFGATLMTAPDDRTIGRQAAGLFEARKSGVATEPISYPAGSEVTLNLKAVKDYGLTFNEDALDSVSRIIRK